MKQYITEKQWKEVSEEQQRTLMDSVFAENIEMNYSWIAINIGTMIQYLGDDFKGIFTMENGRRLGYYRVMYIKFLDSKPSYFSNKELVDALWGAVKYKLFNDEVNNDWKPNDSINYECEHGRLDGHPCPHCMGINDYSDGEINVILEKEITEDDYQITAKGPGN